MTEIKRDAIIAPNQPKLLQHPLQRPADRTSQHRIGREIGITTRHLMPAPARKGSPQVAGPLNRAPRPLRRSLLEVKSALQLLQERAKASDDRARQHPGWHLATATRNQRHRQNVRSRMPAGLAQNRTASAPTKPRAHNVSSDNVARRSRSERDGTHASARAKRQDRAAICAVELRPDLQRSESLLVQAAERLVRTSPPLFTATAKRHRIEFNAGAVVLRAIEATLLWGRAGPPPSVPAFAFSPHSSAFTLRGHPQSPRSARARRVDLSSPNP